MPDDNSSTLAAVIVALASGSGLTAAGTWLWKVWRQKHGDTSADHLGTIAEYRQIVKDQRAELKAADERWERYQEVAEQREAAFRCEARDREDTFRRQADERFDLYRKESHSRAGAMQAEITALHIAHRNCERDAARQAERITHLEERLNGVRDPKKTDDALPRIA